MAATTRRYAENKRAVEEKYMGPLIKTVMTRCIQCTRCVRFVTEVAGVPEIGMISRGEDAEITTYLEKAVTSELSGNVIDLCPVGALTHKPWAFNYRPWELKKTESIDVMDALGSAIRVDARGAEVHARAAARQRGRSTRSGSRDKTRYAVDGLMRQRLDRPYRARERQAARRPPGPRRSTPSPRKLKATAPGPHRRHRRRPAGRGVDEGGAGPVPRRWASTSLDCRQDGSALGGGPREGWLFNPTIAGHRGRRRRPAGRDQPAHARRRC